MNYSVLKLRELCKSMKHLSNGQCVYLECGIFCPWFWILVIAVFWCWWKRHFYRPAFRPDMGEGITLFKEHSFHSGNKMHFITSTLLQCKRQQTRGNKGHAVHYGYENGCSA